MTHEEIRKGLLQLGFNTGWVISGNEIILWEKTEPQPSYEEIETASKLYVEPEQTITDKLASVGLSLDELKAAILGGN